MSVNFPPHCVKDTQHNNLREKMFVMAHSFRELVCHSQEGMAMGACACRSSVTATSLPLVPYLCRLPMLQRFHSLRNSTSSYRPHEPVGTVPTQTIVPAVLNTLCLYAQGLLMCFEVINIHQCVTCFSLLWQKHLIQIKEGFFFLGCMHTLGWIRSVWWWSFFTSGWTGSCYFQRHAPWS